MQSYKISADYKRCAVSNFIEVAFYFNSSNI